MSHQTIPRWIYEIGKAIKEELESREANFKFYALAKGESTNSIDTAQLTMFIKGIDDKYNITKEMAFLVPLKDTTKSRDLNDTMKKILKIDFFVHLKIIQYNYG